MKNGFYKAILHFFKVFSFIAFSKKLHKEKQMAPMTNRGIIVREIARGVALTTLLFAFSLSIPLIGYFCTLFIPLPILYFRVKLGRNAGAIVTVVSAVIMAVITGDAPLSLVFFFKLLLLGFLLGEAVRLNLSVEKTIGYPCAFVMLLGLMGLLFYKVATGANLTAQMTAYMGQVMDHLLVLLREIGISTENTQYIQTYRKDIIHVIVRIMPAQILASTLIEAWITVLTAKSIFQRKGIPILAFGKLNHWKAPDIFVWGAIISASMILLNDLFFLSVGISGLFFFMTIYFFQGIAIVSFFFEKKKFPPMLKFFLYSLIVLQHLILIFVVGIGFSDMWLNFRKLDTKNG